MKALKGLKLIPRKRRINSEWSLLPVQADACTWNFKSLEVQPVDF